MTIGATRRNDANGNDAATTYPYGFKIFAATDLEVKVKKASDGKVTTLTYTAHYTVTGVGSASGGNVVLVDVDGEWQNAADGTLKTGYSIAIVRKAPLTQTTDIRNQGGFFAATHEDVFDKLTMLAQRLDDDLGRAVKLDSAYDTTAYNMTLPAPVASSAIGFNAAGTGLAIISSLAGVATTAFTQSLLDDANAEAFIDTLTAGLSAETAPAIGDRLILDDVSAGEWNTITLENFWKVVNGFTEDTDPDVAADSIAIYDDSAAAARRVRGVNVVGRSAPGLTLINGYLEWSVAGNVLTVAVKTLAGTDPSASDPVHVTFRDATVGAAAPVRRKITAATSISINDTATLGTANGVAFRLWCVAFDDGGTVRLGLINCTSTVAGAGAGRDVTSIYHLRGWGIASSTLEDNSSDSAGVFYTDGAGVTSKPYAVVGYATWESGLATAGTWSAAPTREHAWGIGTPLPGDVIQVQRVPSGEFLSLPTAIPSDDTIPQITEGTQCFSQSITPSSAANGLRVRSTVQCATPGAASMVASALFRDATANALVANATDGYTATARAIVPLEYFGLANSAAATTFSVRAGAPGGGIELNGWSGARKFGGVINSFLHVEEIMA